MTLVVALTGSPSATSRTLLLAQHVERRLAAEGLSVRSVNVRDLPAEDLLYGRGSSPEVREALGALEQAAGVVVATPIYKAAYTGILKCFLDLLPQLGLAGKVVLPLATGGTLAHVLAVDYALRPVLHSPWPAPRRLRALRPRQAAHGDRGRCPRDRPGHPVPARPTPRRVRAVLACPAPDGLTDSAFGSPLFLRALRALRALCVR